MPTGAEDRLVGDSAKLALFLIDRNYTRLNQVLKGGDWFGVRRRLDVTLCLDVALSHTEANLCGTSLGASMICKRRQTHQLLFWNQLESLHMLTQLPTPRRQTCHPDPLPGSPSTERLSTAWPLSAAS